MVYYPLAAAVRCHCPPLLHPRRAPPATAATPLRRRPLQLRPLTSSPGLRTRGRRHAVDPEDDGGEDDGFLTLDLEDFEGFADGDGEEEGPSPWEGAVVYRRDASAQHVEYATTLERLGLADLSSPHSRAHAAAMGIMPPSKPRRGAGDAPAPATTPVLVSVDVARRRGRLRLDGILRTVITLGCYRCAEPAAEGVFANFSLLLTEDPVEEPDVVDLGTIYEEDRTKFPSITGSEDENDEDIDWDDRLHFPAGEKEIDISKNLRDIIHLEITLDAFCSSTCKGLCLVCGANLNTSSCSCSTEEPQAKDARRPGTLKDLLKPMQRRL
ncbi:large ribosomal RNA subunit accumulation protein YCED homolog 1, chloroplastic [Aegilops tauschii subsp. strangulata]|uniref:Uncharacterized protein n=1 Tax=Aegilops tauschii subsp. strangulata TaxID=200361 RepID=A0A453T4F1_AEGTS|nr:large ribosomal RNA subunit accumulation protein YCED homolog 1, chloroplastic [Aegilops tauschii subsp. strangulata]